MFDLTNRHRLLRSGITVSLLIPLAGCAVLGSAMSPYSETFSCKNDDHGQCIHPERAYEDAAAGRTSRSDPAVTRDKDGTVIAGSLDDAIESRDIWTFVRPVDAMWPDWLLEETDEA